MNTTYNVEVFSEQKNYPDHYCFPLQLYRLWEKAPNDGGNLPMQMVQLSILITEDVVDGPVVKVGETFSIDLENPADSSLFRSRSLVLDWNMDDKLMVPVPSPEDIMFMSKERNSGAIPQDILSLRYANRKVYNLEESLQLKVHLGRFSERNGASDLKVKIYGGMPRVLPTFKKGLYEAREEAMLKSIKEPQVFLEGTMEQDAGNGIDGNYMCAFGSETLVSVLDQLDGESGKFSRLLKKAKERGNNYDAADTTRSISQLIMQSRICAQIENTRGECVARFLIDDIQSNDIYFDSAAQLVNEKQSMSTKKVVDWSNAVLQTQMAKWSVDYYSTSSDFELIAKSTLLPETELTEGTMQKYEMELHLPKIDKSNSSSLDPNDFAILIEKCGDDEELSFMSDDPSSRFLYLAYPTEHDDNLLRFLWNVSDKNTITHQVQMRVLVIWKGPRFSGERPKKICDVVLNGDVHGRSYTHFAKISLKTLEPLGLLGFSDVTDAEWESHIHQSSSLDENVGSKSMDEAYHLLTTAGLNMGKEEFIAIMSNDIIEENGMGKALSFDDRNTGEVDLGLKEVDQRKVAASKFIIVHPAFSFI